MGKIIGNTTATPMAIPDWLQTDETKADYIKNKPLEKGEGNNSLQLNKDSDEFKQKDNADYPSYKSGAFGIGSISLSNNGKVDRNHFLDIGNLNVVEYTSAEIEEAENNGKTPQELETDDGGAVIGYKHYTNSRGSTLLGAWGRALNAPCALVSGYYNITTHTTSDKSNSINIGMNNYLFGNTKDSVLFGTSLWNDGSLVTQVNNSFIHIPEAHIGMYNELVKGVQFSIGNGAPRNAYCKELTGSNKAEYFLKCLRMYNENSRSRTSDPELYYFLQSGVYVPVDASKTTEAWYRYYPIYKKKKNEEDYTFVEKPEYELQTIKENNKLHQYSPNKEFTLYFKTGSDNSFPNDYTLITEDTTLEDYQNNTLYICLNGSRSNSFQVTYDGRAQLIRKNNHAELSDNDILIKKEITTSLENILNDAKSYTEDLLKDYVKIDSLTTINGKPITDGGNIEIQGGGISTNDIATNEDIDSILGGNNYIDKLKEQADQIINEQEDLIGGE